MHKISALLNPIYSPDMNCIELFLAHMEIYFKKNELKRNQFKDLAKCIL
jgi:transposase